MTGNRFVLSSIACGVSFGITLGISRGDFGQSFGHGVLTFLASQIGSVVAGRQPTEEDDRQWRAEELRGHIRALQRRRAVTYEELQQLMQERDRAALSLQSIQEQLQQLQTKGNTLWQQKETLSWNLTTPTSRRTTTEIQDFQMRIKQLEREEAELNRSLTATLAAKQRAELHLTTTQSDLSQLQALLAEQKVHKADVLEDLMALSEQQQQLQQAIAQSQQQLDELEQYRKELTQLVQSAEPVRQQVTQGSQSLQGAIHQLQTQISSLHGELETLETQILDRRTEKTVLDDELETLRAHTRSLATPPDPSHRVPSHRLATVSDPWHDHDSSAIPKSLGVDSAATLPLDFSQYPQVTPPWIDFAVKLPRYEFQALSAIAHQSNPSPQLKQISEANLTMPELLIDAINERALETIGDIILEPSPNKGIPIIAQEYETSVRAILRVYEASL
jgi:TerB-C domain